MRKLVTTLVVIAVIGIIFVMLGPFYVVQEGEQAVVTRFGEIVDSTTTAGLKFKTPVVDTVVKYPQKILSWDGDARRIPTQENQFIWVDATARWEITDPELFYARVTTIPGAYSRLDDIIESALRLVITQNPLHEAVRNTNVINEIEREVEEIIPEGGEELDREGLEQIAELITTVSSQQAVVKGRRALSEEMLASAAPDTDDFGIELIDIVIRQIRYSDELTESVFDRMVSERQRIAQAYRSYGEGRRQEILGEMERDRERILSQAFATAEEVRGNADAQAAQLYSQSYQQSPEFFEFWRAIESYRETLPRFRKTLTTDMDYFRFLYSEDG